MLSKQPMFFSRSLRNHIVPCYDMFKDVFLDDDKAIKTLIESSRVLPTLKNFPRNISVLRQLGVTQPLMTRLITIKPGVLFGKNKFGACVKKVIEMGFNPTKFIFMDALLAMYELSDNTMEHKLDVYRGLGLSEDEIWSAFKKYPAFTRYSEKKITDSVNAYRRFGFTGDEFRIVFKKFPACIGYSESLTKGKMDFLMSKMGWQHAEIVKAPNVLGYSLEKRIIPRCNVVRVLKLKGLIEGEISLSYVLASTQKQSVRSFCVKIPRAGGSANGCPSREN